MTVIYEELVRRRSKALRCMFILSVLMLLTSVTSLVVGIFAVQTSNTVFPFNAGGAIIAGIMSFLLSLCPMYMYYTAKQEGYPDTLDEGCCGCAFFFWGLFTLLGTLFGFIVNGIVAVIVCVRPSNDIDCETNSDTKIILAILTIILTIILMILPVVIAITCCCNACKDVHTNDIHVQIPDSSPIVRNRRSIPHRQLNIWDRGTQNGIYLISNNDHLPGTSGEITNSDSNNANSNQSDFRNSNIYVRQPTAPTAPTAPPEYWSTLNGDSSPTRELGARTDRRQFPQEHNQANERRGHTQMYDDLPPTYEEVMENDPMETPL